MFDNFAESVANSINAKLKSLFDFYHKDDTTKKLVQISGVLTLGVVSFIMSFFYWMFIIPFAASMGYVGWITVQEFNRQNIIREEAIKKKYAEARRILEEKQKKRREELNSKMAQSQKEFEKTKEDIFDIDLDNVFGSVEKTVDNSMESLDKMFKNFDKKMKKMDKKFDDLFDEDDMGF